MWDEELDETLWEDMHPVHKYSVYWYTDEREGIETIFARDEDDAWLDICDDYKIKNGIPLDARIEIEDRGIA